MSVVFGISEHHIGCGTWEGKHIETSVIFNAVKYYYPQRKVVYPDTNRYLIYSRSLLIDVGPECPGALLLIASHVIFPHQTPLLLLSQLWCAPPLCHSHSPRHSPQAGPANRNDLNALIDTCYTFLYLSRFSINRLTLKCTDC